MRKLLVVLALVGMIVGLTSGPGNAATPLPRSCTATNLVISPGSNFHCQYIPITDQATVWGQAVGYDAYAYDSQGRLVAHIGCNFINPGPQGLGPCVFEIEFWVVRFGLVTLDVYDGRASIGDSGSPS